MAVAGFSSLEFEVKAVFMLKISGPCEVGNVTNQNFMAWLKQLFSNFVSFQSVFNVWSLRSMRTQTNKKNPLALKWSFLNSIMTHWCYQFYTNPELRVNVQNLFILADTPAQHAVRACFPTCVEIFKRPRSLVSTHPCTCESASAADRHGWWTWWYLTCVSMCH